MTSTAQNHSERIAAIGRALSELDAELRALSTQTPKASERSQLAALTNHLHASLKELERAKSAAGASPVPDSATESANVISLFKFMESIPAIVFFKDSDCRYIAVNRHYEDQLGRPASEVVGKLDSDLFPPEHASTYARSDEAVLKSGEALEFEERIDIGEESQVFLVSKFPIRNAAGAIIAIAGMASYLPARRATAIDPAQTLRSE